MTTQTTRLVSFYSPLWGASFDSDNVGKVGDHVTAYFPELEEWWQIQKSDVWKERVQYDGLFPGLDIEDAKPPLCLVVVNLLGENEEFYEGIDRLRNSMISQTKDAVLALRLLKSGWFLDPDLAEQVFNHEGFNLRQLGPYRQIFLTDIPDIPLDCYALKISELSISKDEKAPVTHMWDLIQNYRVGKPHASAEIAIENFRRSYGFQLSGTQRATFLFIALDAMLGGMSSWKIGKLKLKSKFRERILVGLSDASSDKMIQGKHIDQVVLWLDNGETGGRAMRNSLAHGRPSSVEMQAEQRYLLLQEIVRLLLRQYLEFSTLYSIYKINISSLLGIPNFYSPKEAYNKFLEMRAQGASSIPTISDLTNLLRRAV